MVQIVAEYRDYQSLIRGYSSKVVKTTYRELVKFVHRLVDEGRALQDIDLGFLEKYVIERTAGRSLGYRNILIGCLRSFFGYLCDQEVCPTNPARYLAYTKLDPYQRLPEVVSESRMKHCLRYLSEQATLPGIRREYTPIKKRNLALVALIYGTGIRSGEAAALKLSDILWDQQILVIRAGKGRKERRVPLMEEVLEPLVAYLKTRPHAQSDEPLFLSWRGNPLNSTTVGMVFKRYSDAWGRPIHPHQLRHTCASHLLQNGGKIVSIKNWLGHKKLATTLHYARIQNPELAEAVDVHPLNYSNPRFPKDTSDPPSARPVRRKYTSTVPAEPLSGRLWEQITEFLATAESIGKYSPASIKEFRFSLTRFAVGCPLCLRGGVETARGADIISWLSARRQAGISRCTIDKNLSHLRSFLSYAVHRGWRADNPMEAIKMASHVPQEQTYLSEDEMLRLLAQPDRSSADGFSDYIFILVLYATGLRVGELSALDIQDMDLKGGWITVREGKGRDRQVPIPKAAIPDLKEYVGLYRKAASGPLLLNMEGRRLMPWSMARLLRRYAQAAGIQKPVTPHTLRHTFTAHLLKRGARVEVVAKALGHKSLVETNPYIHVDFDDLRDAVKLLRKNIPPLRGDTGE